MRRKNDHERVREKLLALLKEKHGFDLVYHPSHGQRVYKIQSKSDRIFLYLLASRPGWWGFSFGVEKYLKTHADHWLVVFFLVIDRSTADGWIMDNKQWHIFSRHLGGNKSSYSISNKDLNKADKVSGVDAIAASIADYLGD